DIHVPFVAAVFLQSLVALGVSLPSAPGFFGLFESFAKVGLVQVFGVDPARAVGFAIGFHIGGFVPITLVGLWYAWRIGLSRSDVVHGEEIVEEDVEAEARHDAQP
ncbi:MAG TPA: lysylphosphatidylglycerol synthase domain-containing protein, partial [Longimicrobiales bacterium]